MMKNLKNFVNSQNKDLKMSDKGGVNYNHSLKTLGNGGIVQQWVVGLKSIFTIYFYQTLFVTIFICVVVYW